MTFLTRFAATIGSACSYRVDDREFCVEHSVIGEVVSAWSGNFWSSTDSNVWGTR